MHPSCGLDGTPDWVIFNEFVLTTQPYIRTVSAIEPEWLFKHAPSYFDLSTFPNGATKNALEIVEEQFKIKEEAEPKEQKKKRNRKKPQKKAAGDPQKVETQD